MIAQCTMHRSQSFCLTFLKRRVCVLQSASNPRSDFSYPLSDLDQKHPNLLRRNETSELKTLQHSTCSGRTILNSSNKDMVSFTAARDASMQCSRHPLGLGALCFQKAKDHERHEHQLLKTPPSPQSLATNRSASQYGVEIARDVVQGLLFG